MSICLRKRTKAGRENGGKTLALSLLLLVRTVVELITEQPLQGHDAMLNSSSSEMANTSSTSRVDAFSNIMGSPQKRKISSLSLDSNIGVKENVNVPEDGNSINLKEAVELQCALVEIAEKRQRGGRNVQSKITELSSDGESWIVHIRNYNTPSLKCNNLFEEIWQKHPKNRKCVGRLFGGKKDCFENRYSQSYGIPFSYSGYKDDKPRPIEEDSVLIELLSEINSSVRKNRGPYNGCLVNWYLPEHTIAAHSDDETSMKRQSPIFSLSWGGPRRFVFRPKLKYQKNSKYKSLDVTLHSGDLLIMGGSLQQTHTHEVPKWRKTKDPFVPSRRINWTVRAFIENNEK